MAYLLGRDALLAILAGDADDPIGRWSQGVDNGDLFVNVLTLGEVEAAAQNLPPARAETRNRYLDLLETHVPRVFASRIIEVTLPLAREWGRVLQQVAARGLSLTSEQAMEVATARERGFDYVAPANPELEQLGVRVVDPRSDG